jgi:hypothetical protein
MTLITFSGVRRVLLFPGGFVFRAEPNASMFLTNVLIA